MPSPTRPTASNALKSSKAEPNWATRYGVFFLIAAAGCLLDLWTKHAVFQWRGMPQRDNIYWLVENYFGIETALNNGAVFGLGQGGTPVFAALSLAAGVGIVLWFCRVAWRDRLLTVALGMILGGIGGNLYDRLGMWEPPGMPGERVTQVRDWILMCWGPDKVWPNYNIADCLLVCGAALLMIHICFFDSRPKAQAPSTEEHPDDDTPGDPEGDPADDAPADPAPAPADDEPSDRSVSNDGFPGNTPGV